MAITTKIPTNRRARSTARARRYRPIEISGENHTRGNRFRLSLIIAIALVLFAAGAAARGRGFKSSVVNFARDLKSGRLFLTRPAVSDSDPRDNDDQVPTDQLLAVTLQLPNGSLDENTVGEQSVILTRADDQKKLAALVNIIDGSDVISVQPATPLGPQTRYVLTLRQEIKDLAGARLKPCSISFVTAAPAKQPIAFEKIAMQNTFGLPTTAVAIGPDHKLYAAADDGRIVRYAIKPDGTLADRQVLNSLRDAEGQARLVSGFCFDPASTADNLMLWVSSNFYAFHNAPDFSGKITLLSGPNLQNVADKVIHLPRSANDHLTNQPSFGPDGALYFPQGSMTATGAPDNTWGNRAEHLLSGAILRLDVKRLSDVPLDVQTSDGGGTYDPAAPGAPLTIYASGVRNAFDLLWHSNGHLYVPTNGASCGGNTPAGPGIPALTNIPFNETDWLFCITPGKYYGHPNPLQKHFVLNGGNPAAGHHFGDTPQYPVGTKSDADWEPAVYDFGRHISANGIAEYSGPAFGGKLNGAMLVCRYNLGADIIALWPDSAGNIGQVKAAIPGLAGFRNPLDLVVDRATGNIYVSDYGAMKLYLLRPVKS